MHWAQGGVEHKDHRVGKGTGTVAVSVGQLFGAGAEAAGEPVTVSRTSCAVWMKQGNALLQQPRVRRSKPLWEVSKQGRQPSRHEGTVTQASDLVELLCGIRFVPACRPTEQPGSPNRRLQK